MTVKIVQATIEDADAITELRVRGMKNDPLWKASMGSASYEEQIKCIGGGIRSRLGARKEIGASQIWKAVDEDGNLLAFTGLEIPISPTIEELARMRVKGEPLPGGNELLEEFSEKHFAPLLGKHGYNPEKHFKQLGLMASPEHQRKGLGRLLTKKVGQIADERSTVLYVEAGPQAAALFRSEGYEELQRLDIDLEEFGADGGVTSMFIMKREPRISMSS